MDKPILPKLIKEKYGYSFYVSPENSNEDLFMYLCFKTSGMFSRKFKRIESEDGSSLTLRYSDGYLAIPYANEREASKIRDWAHLWSLMVRGYLNKKKINVLKKIKNSYSNKRKIYG